jgi:hypothetical protein
MQENWIGPSLYTCNRDLYEGRIAAFGRHYWTTGWRWVHLAPGYATVADAITPNQHFGLWPKEIAADAQLRARVEPHDVFDSPFARVGALLGRDDIKIVPYVRFGRTAQLVGGPLEIVDPFPRNPGDPGWGRYEWDDLLSPWWWPAVVLRMVTEHEERSRPASAAAPEPRGGGGVIIPGTGD